MMRMCARVAAPVAFGKIECIIIGLTRRSDARARGNGGWIWGLRDLAAGGAVGMAGGGLPGDAMEDERGVGRLGSAMRGGGGWGGGAGDHAQRYRTVGVWARSGERYFEALWGAGGHAGGGNGGRAGAGGTITSERAPEASRTNRVGKAGGQAGKIRAELSERGF